MACFDRGQNVLRSYGEIFRNPLQEPLEHQKHHVIATGDDGRVFALKLWRHGARSNELVQTHQWCVAANPPPASPIAAPIEETTFSLRQAAELTFKAREGSALGRSFLRRQN